MTRSNGQVSFTSRCKSSVLDNPLKSSQKFVTAMEVASQGYYVGHMFDHIGHTALRIWIFRHIQVLTLSCRSHHSNTERNNKKERRVNSDIITATVDDSHENLWIFIFCKLCAFLFPCRLRRVPSNREHGGWDKWTETYLGGTGLHKSAEWELCFMPL